MKSAFAAFVCCLALALLSPTANGATEQDASQKQHFTIVSSAKEPTPDEIARYLEQTWQTFHDVFGVDPATVNVVINVTSATGNVVTAVTSVTVTTVTSGSGAPSSQSGQERPAGAPQRQMPWAINEGEALSSQRFSDLSHEITHIYFIDYMEDKGGMHHSHAWLHEAVSCYSEQDPSRKSREQWARDHINDHIPFEQLFTMKNPLKETPAVELTVRLHEKLVRGEMSVDEVNRQISEFVTTHPESAETKIRNVTYYAESLSIFEFLLKTEGKDFIRAMSQQLKSGKSMAEIIQGLTAYPKGIPQFEQAWVAWVQAG